MHSRNNYLRGRQVRATAHFVIRCICSMNSIQTTGFCVQIVSVLLYAVDRVHLSPHLVHIRVVRTHDVRIPQPMLDTQFHPAESTVWITRNHHSTSATAELRAHRSRARLMLSELGKVNIEGCWRLQKYIFEWSMNHHRTCGGGIRRLN